MKKYILAFTFSIFAMGLYAQSSSKVDIEVGDTFEIGRPDADQYQHIDFPKPNLIIKRGGLANYKRVEGNKVTVTSVKEKKDGTLLVKLKKADGSRFFGSHWQVAANVKEAMASGELRKI